MDKIRQYEPLWGEWFIDEKIGEGSFGQVYRIKRTHNNNVYFSAVKIITIPQNSNEITSLVREGMDHDSVTSYFEDILNSLIEEIDLLYSFKGLSNIVNIDDYKVIKNSDGITYDVLIKMELLTDILTHVQYNPLNKQDILKLALDMCKALESVHSQNIIHRDIKPENIFISKHGDYKLGDFGVARKMEKTLSGLSKKGTYLYMAPEVYKGEDYNLTADIYSLGIVLYRFLNNGKLPFLNSTQVMYKKREEALARRLKGEEIPFPESGSGEFEEIVLKACRYNSNDRFQNVPEMRKALEKVVLDSNEIILNQRELQTTTILEKTDVIRSSGVSENELEGDSNLVHSETFNIEENKTTLILSEDSLSSNEGEREVFHIEENRTTLITPEESLKSEEVIKEEEILLQEQTDILEETLITDNPVLTEETNFENKIQDEEVFKEINTNSKKLVSKRKVNPIKFKKGPLPIIAITVVIFIVFGFLINLYLAENEYSSLLKLIDQGTIEAIDTRIIKVSNSEKYNTLLENYIPKALESNKFEEVYSLLIDPKTNSVVLNQYSEKLVTFAVYAENIEMATDFINDEQIRSNINQDIDSNIINKLIEEGDYKSAEMYIFLLKDEESKQPFIYNIIKRTIEDKEIAEAKYWVSQVSNYIELHDFLIQSIDVDILSNFEYQVNARSLSILTLYGGSIYGVRDLSGNILTSMPVMNSDSETIILLKNNIVKELDSELNVCINNDDTCHIGTSDWKGIVEISAGDNFGVGLRRDGTVMGGGQSYNKSLELIQTWEDITQVCAGYSHIAGLKSNGEVIAVGENLNGQLEVTQWKNISMISCGDYSTVALTKTGKVLEANSENNTSITTNKWSDLIAVSTNGTITVGLKNDFSYVTSKPVNGLFGSNIILVSPLVLVNMEGSARSLDEDEDYRYVYYSYDKENGQFLVIKRLNAKYSEIDMPFKTLVTSYSKIYKKNDSGSLYLGLTSEILSKETVLDIFMKSGYKVTFDYMDGASSTNAYWKCCTSYSPYKIIDGKMNYYPGDVIFESYLNRMYVKYNSNSYNIGIEFYPLSKYK